MADMFQALLLSLTLSLTRDHIITGNTGGVAQIHSSPVRR